MQVQELASSLSDVVNPQGAWLQDNPWAVVLLAITGLGLALCIPMVLRFMNSASGTGTSRPSPRAASYPLLLSGGPHDGEQVKRGGDPAQLHTPDGHTYVRTGEFRRGHPVYEWADPSLRG